MNPFRRLLKPTPSQIGIIVSYPKSGRTWLRVMFEELGVNFHYTHDGFGSSKSRPFDELRVCRRERYQNQPVVFLYRDPRDTTVSEYFWRALHKESYAGTITDFIRDPLCGFERIVLFNLTWLERGRRLRAFLPITYEEISANPASSVRRILAFVGTELSDRKIVQVVENNTFEKMQKREFQGEHVKYMGKMFTQKVDEPEAYKVRRGKMGGYVDYLSPEDISYCDHVLDRCGYFRKLAWYADSRQGYQPGKGVEMVASSELGGPL